MSPVVHRTVSLILVALATFGMTGCAGVAPAPELPKLAFVEQEPILASLRSAPISVASYRGLARAVVHQGQDRVGLRYGITWALPESLRIESFAPGTAIALATVAGSPGRVVALDATEKRAYVGEDLDYALRKTAGIPLKVRDLMSLLVGQVAPGSIQEEVELYRGVRGDRAQEVLVLSRVSDRTQWVLDSKQRVVAATFMGRGASVVARTSASDFRDDWCAGASIPSKVQMELPEEQLSIQLILQQVRCNEVIPAALFAVAVPNNYSVWSGLSSER